MFVFLPLAFANTVDLDGGWSPWSKLQTPCTKSPEDSTLVHCEGGVRIRYRSCTMPVPQGPEGEPCQGSDIKYEPCNTHPCQLPEDHLWSSWSSCSKTCGRGISKRHTMCGNIRSKYLKTTDVDETIDTTTVAAEADDATTTVAAEDDHDTTTAATELEYEEKCRKNQVTFCFVRLESINIHIRSLIAVC